MDKFVGNTKCLENYTSQFVVPKIEEIFQEKYLEDTETSLSNIIFDYLSENLEDIVEESYDGEDFDKCDYLLNEDTFHDVCLKTIESHISESDLIESVSEPYRGLSDWERNNM